jgi:YVTN family beta-propeller protein
MTRIRSTRLALGVGGVALVLGLARVAVALLGDVTGDGTVNNSDAQQIQEAVVGTRTLTPAQLADADVDGDGDVDVSDAQQIRQFAAGALSGFPVRTPQQSGPIALTRDGDLLGVVNPDTDSATFVTTATEVVRGEVAIGREPTGVAFTRDGSRALVTVGRDAEVAVVDTATLAVTNRIPVGVEPFGVVVNFRGDRAYVSNLASGTVSVIDLASETVVATVPVAPKPEGLAVTADSSRIFVTHLFGGQVSVINAATRAVSSIPLAEIAFDENNSTQPAGKPNRMKGIAIHPVRNEAWLPHILSNSGNFVETLFNTTIFPAVSVLDTAAPAEEPGARMTLFAGLSTVVSNPEAVAFTPDGDLGLVVSAASNDLTIIDATTRQQVGLVRDVGDNPRGIVVNGDGTLAYVFNRLTPSVSVVDVPGRRLAREIAVSHPRSRRTASSAARPATSTGATTGRRGSSRTGRGRRSAWPGRRRTPGSSTTTATG